MIWEYKTSVLEGISDFNALLDKLGQDGWELVTVINKPLKTKDYYLMFFKKRKD